MGDVVSLTWHQITAAGIYFVAQKTGKAGVATISDELRARLMAYRTSSRWVFPSPRNPRKHITRQAVWYRVKRACERAGIDPEGVAPHSFRKYFAVEHDRTITTEDYAMSDFITGENAEKPLLRRDLTLVVKLVAAALKNRS